MQKLDPTKMKDWEIAEAAEAGLRPAKELATELGLQEDEWTPYGRVLAKDARLGLVLKIAKL